MQKNDKSSIQMDVPGVELSRVAATAKEGLTKPEWRRALKQVGRLAVSSQWWLGDLISSSEDVFGEHYAAVASKETGLKPKTIREYVYVARHVASEVRRTDLTHAHHALVAAYADEDDQRRLLALAAERDLTVAEFRCELGRKTEPTPPTYEPQTADDISICPECGQAVSR